MKFIEEKYRVEEMACASCAISAHPILSVLEGVENVVVNYANSVAWIEHDREFSDFNRMHTTLQKIGYRLIRSDSENYTERSERLKGERNSALNRVIFSMVFAIPLFVISMIMADFRGNNWVKLALILPVMAWFGRSFFINAIKHSRHILSNMDTLVAMGTGIACLFSLFNTIALGLLISKGSTPPVYYESVVVIMTFILLGRSLEERAKTITGQLMDPIRNTVDSQASHYYNY